MTARIDAHMHYWRLGRSDYAWMRPQHAAIQRNFLPADLEPQLAASGIDGTILVQADATARETDFLLEIAGTSPSVLGVVGWIDFTAPNAVSEVERRAEQKKIRGLRPMLEFIEDPEWILQPDFAPVFVAMLRCGLSFDALVHPQHLQALDMLACRYPDLPIVIDHGAKPKIAAWRNDAHALQSWMQDMKRMAGHPQVCCKLSGLLTEAGPQWQPADLLPAIRILLDLFGPTRLIWGSDWPVMTLAGQYGDWIALTDRALDGLSDTERDLIYRKNALSFYRL
jgi:L-fuconolactonase